MAGNGALDLSIRIMGKVDPSLARSISQVKGLTGSLTDGLKSTNFLAGTVAKTLGVVGKTGLALGATLTGSVLVGMKQVTNEAAKLEAQMAPVMRYVDGLADASGKASNAMAQNGKTFAQNYADMKNYIQDLSTEIPRTTEQITTMSAALGQSGKDVTEQLQSGILRDTAVAATAMDLDDQTAGDYMAKWEVAFTKRDTEGNKTNYSHDDVMRLMNQINYLGANNATTAAEIASSVNKSASIGQLAGVDPSTTAAIATAMQATGVDTERTGTTISRIYTNISKGSSATKAQKEMWEELGFTATGIASSMQKDGTGTLMKVFGAINKLPDERKIAALNTLFNQWAVEGGAKVTNNLDLLMKTLSEVGDESAYSGSMEREFAINTGTEESLRTMRDNAKTVLMQDLGDSFLPAQKELTRLQLDIYKGIDELRDVLALTEEKAAHSEEHKQLHRIGLGQAIATIMVMDLVFSIDSVITAVGLAEHLIIMIMAVIFAIVIMMVFIDAIADFINRHTEMKILALVFITVIGLLLFFDSLGINSGIEVLGMHMEKLMVYCAMVFAVVLELIQMRYSSNLAKWKEERRKEQLEGEQLKSEQANS